MARVDGLYSSMRFLGDGVTKVVSLTFDLGVGDGLTVDFGRGLVTEGYVVDRDSNPVLVIFDSPLPLGDTITIRRVTDIGEVPHIFQEKGNAQGGAEFSALNIDENFENITRASQDASDSQTLASLTLEEMAGIRDDALEYRNDAQGFRDEAGAFAGSAQLSASEAEVSANLAGASSTASMQYMNLAKKWATNPEGEVVEDGKYSAYHWAMHASEVVGFDITDYRKLDNNEFNGFVVSKASSDVGTGYFLLCPDGMVRGQMIYNNYGLQFAQVQGDGTHQTFTFPRYGDGGEIMVSSELGYVTPEMYGAIGDGSSNDTGAVINALQVGLPVVLQKQYKITTDLDLDSLHLLEGSGYLLKGSDRFYARPLDNTVNVLYVNEGGGDGLSANSATSFDTAVAFIRKLGDKALQGAWRIQFLAGTFKIKPVRFDNFPYFKNRLQIQGEPVSLGDVPKTILDGTDSTSAYAILTQQQSGQVRVEFKDIKPINWDNGTSNSGFCVLWTFSDVLATNVHFEDSKFGISIREGYLKVLGGTSRNCRLPHNPSYHTVANIGSIGIANGGHTYIDCEKGIEGGRYALVYVEGNTFENCVHDIECNRFSRIVPQGNTHTNWKGSAYRLHLNSLLNAKDVADSFSNVDPKAVIVENIGNNIISAVHNGTTVSLHHTASSLLEVTTSPNVPVILGGLDLGYVPYRLPRYFFKATTATLRVEVLVGISESLEGTLTLRGGSSSTSLNLNALSLSSLPVGISKVVLEVSKDANGNILRLASVDSKVVNSSYIDVSELVALNYFEDSRDVGRLYLSTPSASSISFRGLKTYVEI